MTDGITLTAKQRHDLLSVFGRFAPPVTAVDVFGSRARGDASTGSDVDLIVHGDVNLKTVLRIGSALDDSYLSIAADVTAYAMLKDDAFAREVRRAAKPLFSTMDLASAPAFRPVDGLLEWYRPIAA